MSATVTLSWAEVHQACTTGVTRHVLNLRQGNHDAHNGKDLPFDLHVQGALAELAYAKWANVYWQAIAADPKTLPGDVGPVQIRSTKHRSGCLILHDRDPDTATFFLVINDLPRFHIIGSIRGSDGKRREFWREGQRPAYFVPQSHLADPEPQALAA